MTLRHALLPGILSLLVGAAWGDKILALDNRYEATRLPVHFDRNPHQDNGEFALSVGLRQTNTFALQRADTGQFKVRNASGVGDVSLLFEKGRASYGFSIGASPADHGLTRVGAFGGYGLALGPVHLTGSAGLMLNNSWNEVHYRYTRTEYIWIIPVAIEVREDSNRVLKPRLEIPLQAGLLFETGTAFSPFATASFSKVLIGTGDGGENVRVYEASGGVQWDASARSRVHVEATARKDIVDVGPLLAGETGSPLLFGARISWAAEF